MSDLETPTGEIAAALARVGLGSLFPVIGPLAGEVISNIIPNKRIDRVHRLLRALEARVDRLDPAGMRERLLGEPVFSDLFEDAMFDAVRATSDDRIEYIAEILQHGLQGNGVRAVESRAVLRLFHDVNDAEIILLAGHLSKNRRNPEFWARHRALLAISERTNESSLSEIDTIVIRGLREQRLFGLGLLGEGQRWERRLPLENYETPTHIKLTGAGLLLLRRIGLASEYDQ